MEPDEVAQPQEHEEHDADFDAGFSGSPSPAPTETPEPAPQPTENQDPQPEPTPEAEPAPEYAQITKTEFEDLRNKAAKLDALEQGQNKVFGKIGGLERILTQLQQQTATGQVVEVSESDFEELAKEFPEMASLQLKGLNRVLGKLKGTGGAVPLDNEKVSELVREHIAPVTENIRREVEKTFEQKLETRLLSRSHPDWRDVIGLPAKPGDAPPDTPYRQWLAKQTQEYQQQIGNAWDADVISESIDKFRADQKAEQAAAKEAAATAKAKQSTRREVLAAATTPKGSGGTASGPTGEDEFDAGFKKYHGA